MTTKLFLTIIIIAIFTVVMSGCSDVVNVAVNAMPDNSTTAISVQASPRISNCNSSERANLINAVNADVHANNDQPLSMSTSAWLDNMMSTYTCIAQ